MSKGLEKATAILKALGLEDNEIEAFKDDAKAEALDVAAIAKNVVEIQREIAEQDEAFTAPIRSAERGAILTKRLDLLKKEYAGYITDDEINKLPERSRFDDALRLAKKNMEAKLKAGSGGDPELQKEIEKLNAQISERDEQLKKLRDEEIPAIENKWQSQLQARERDLTLRQMFDKTTAGQLVVNGDLLWPAIKAQLEGKYDVKIENGEAVIYEKGKATKVFKNSKPVKLEDVIREEGDAQGIFKKQPDPPKPPKPGDPKAGNEKFSMREQRNAEMLKQMEEARKAKP